MKNFYTESTQFFGKTSPEALLQTYGSPLYVYNEAILRQKCQEMRQLAAYSPFWVDYSSKANTNLSLLRIIHEEGIHADAMSPGEVYTLLKAGFSPDELFFVCNNVSAEEMAFAVKQGVLVSTDSLAQLELFGRSFPGERVAVRMNPGVGVGHHSKVITAGKHTKFGIDPACIPQVQAIIKTYGLRLVGINQHLGSLFMEGDQYMQGVAAMLELCKQFPDLEFIDLGGGFGIPYRKQEGEASLHLVPLGERLTQAMTAFAQAYGKHITFRIEPGRYLVAECGILLGRVQAIKENSGTTYIGTDIGFNVLQRPILYDSHHDIEVFHQNQLMKEVAKKPVTVVGNICESGDKLAQNRILPPIVQEDILAVMDAGAYGYSMASNYNHRLRPAEVLIDREGMPRLIRRRDTLEDLVRGFTEA